MKRYTLQQVTKMRQLALMPGSFGDLAPNSDDDHGEIFTRKWVVELILDLVGYTMERDLAKLRTVEPACGTGAFLAPLIERLSASCKRHGRPLTDSGNALRAFDLLSRNIDQARSVVMEILRRDSWPERQIEEVVTAWLNVGDYLLMPHDFGSVDFVVGNPPYIRLEDVPEARMRAYRHACRTMTGRSDIYVGFYEIALASLNAGGRLGFICADRWMRNQYGRVLRRLIADEHDLEISISMHDVDAFEDQVAAYPAITVIRRGHQRAAVVADTTSRFGPNDAAEVLGYVRSDESETIANDRYEIARLPHWFEGEESWPAGNPKKLAIIEFLAERFPALEDPKTGTRVGIGVATGADEVFITKVPPDIEGDRLLPLAMVRDLASGKLDWSGYYLVNPWTEDGKLVSLAKYPLLSKYFDKNGFQLKNRHIAGKLPAAWYRTIDKVNPALTGRAKILIPDMRLTIHPVLDVGKTYPHHNLYYVVSDTWDMRVLGGLLMSRVAQAFIEAYAVRMRGGTLRFQAQYLRRIRVPRPEDLSDDDQAELVKAFELRDVDRATSIAIRLYGLEALRDEFTTRSKI